MLIPAMFKKCIGATLALIGVLIDSNGYAQTVVPNEFIPGTTARANEINENFSALAAAIDAQATEIDALGAITFSERLVCAQDPTNPAQAPIRVFLFGLAYGFAIRQLDCIDLAAPETATSQEYRDLLADGWSLIYVSDELAFFGR